MLMRADIFIARIPDQQRAGDELERPAAAAATETAFAHKRHRMTFMRFGEARIVWTGVAAEIKDAKRRAFEQRLSLHGGFTVAIFGGAIAADQWAAEGWSSGEFNRLIDRWRAGGESGLAPPPKIACAAAISATTRCGARDIPGHRLLPGLRRFRLSQPPRQHIVSSECLTVLHRHLGFDWNVACRGRRRRRRR